MKEYVKRVVDQVPISRDAEMAGAMIMTSLHIYNDKNDMCMRKAHAIDRAFDMWKCLNDLYPSTPAEFIALLNEGMKTFTTYEDIEEMDKKGEALAN